MRPSRKSIAKGVGVVMTAALLAVPLSASFVGASSHREAPLASQDPAADLTDTYAFVSPDRPDTISMIGCYYPFQEPGGGPNFYRFADDAEYLLHVDNDGDAKSDATFVFRFRTEVRNPDIPANQYVTGAADSLDSPNLNIRQFYSVWRISDPGEPIEVRWMLADNLPVPPNNIGPRSTPNHLNTWRSAVRSIGDGYNVFAGQTDDPFFIDLAATFDLVAIRPGPPGNMGGGKDTIAGYNVNCINLQAPIAFLTKNGAFNKDAKDPNAILGIWWTASRPTMTVRTASGVRNSGDMVQVSRLGMPLVNELVIPYGLKDAFNGLDPRQDGAALSRPDGSIPAVQDPYIAKALNLLYGVKVPPAPRNDLVTVFLTGVPGLNQPTNVKAAEMLRINTAIAPVAAPNRLGVIAGDLQGYPNGRRLGDDIVDISLRVAAGVLVDGFNVSPNNALGDGVDANDRPFSTVFPYLAPPHEGFAQVGQQ
jgi:hypothetical protein